VSLWNELKRRNVFRVAAAYVVVGWLILQVAEILLGFTGAPDWVGKALIALLLLGFVPALALAWVFEVGPHGIHRDDGSLPRDAGPQARRLDVVTLVAVVFVVLLLVGQHLGSSLTGSAPAGEGAGAPEGDPPRAEAKIDAPARIAREPTEAAPIEPPAGSIAVLPFTNRSTEPDTAFFVDGIHDDLITQLAKISALRVISRTSVSEYRDSGKKIPEIAAELNVAAVLEGAVQRAGNRVRITAQLIRASDDTHLWADSFDRELSAETLFELQSELARNIAAALQATLTPAEVAAVEKVLTSDLPALEAYRRAVALLDRIEFGNLDEAQRLLELAIARDPGFAAAHATIARTHVARHWFEGADSSVVQLAEAALARARTLDPELLEVQLAEGYVRYWGDRDYDAALAAIGRARAIAPGAAATLVLQGFVLRRMGRFEEARDALYAVRASDPRNQSVLAELAHLELRLGQVNRARALLAEAHAVDPASSFPNQIRGLLLIEADGDLDTARRESTGFRAGTAGFAWVKWWLAVAQGDLAAALAASDFGIYADSVNSGTYYPPTMMRALALYSTGEASAARAAFIEARDHLEIELSRLPGDPGRLRAQCLVLSALRAGDDAAQVCAAADRAEFRDAWTSYPVYRALGRLLAGDKTGALDEIETILLTPAGGLPLRFDLDPLFAPLHDDPRFLSMMQRYREFLGQ
jgi:TolB-like protein/thioredoxin-like negative regulator of GroEL